MTLGETIDIVWIVLPQAAMNTPPNPLRQAAGGPIKKALASRTWEKSDSNREEDDETRQDDGNDGPCVVERRTEQHETTEEPQRHDLLTGAEALPELAPR